MIRKREKRRWEEGKTVQPAPQSQAPHLPPTTLLSYFSGNVVAVDGFLLQEHVKTALVLGQRVTGNSAEAHTEGKQTGLTALVWLLWNVSANANRAERKQAEEQRANVHRPVDELLQAHPPLLDERLLKEAFVWAKRQLPLQGFARQGWYYNLGASVVDTNMVKIKHDPLGFCCSSLSTYRSAA